MKTARILALLTVLIPLAGCASVCRPVADLDSEFNGIIDQLAELGLVVDSISDLLERYEAGGLDEWASTVDGAGKVLADLHGVLVLLADLCSGLEPPPVPGMPALASGTVKVRYAGVTVTVESGR